MTMRHRPTGILRAALAALLGIAAALLVSCGSSGKGLIPAASAGPLQSDFEAVAQAAQNGDGSCTTTAEAIRKTEQDFNALPITVDASLREKLSQGITNLRSRALSLCAQPLPQTTVTSPAPRTSTTNTQSTATTPTTTQTTSTQTTPTATAPTTSSPGGGTPAPGAGDGESSQGAGPGGGDGQGGGDGHGGGAGPGQGGGAGVGEAGGAGVGVGGGESGK
jgi:hypothetical protein